MDSKLASRELPIQSLFSEQLGLALIVLLFLLATLTWQLFFTQTLAAWLPGILGTVIGFTFVGIFFFVGATLWHNYSERAGASFAILVPLLWHLPWLLALPVILVGSAFFWSAIKLIHVEQRSRIRFQFVHVNSAGKFMFALALCMALTVSYYSRLQDASWEAVVSDYQIGETTNAFVYRALSFLTPELKQNANAESTTVDDYLKVQLQQSGGDGTMPEDAATADVLNNPVVVERYLRSGREQFSKMLGRDVHGDEPISRVFAEYTQARLVAALQRTHQVQMEGDANPLLPVAIALLIFLALLPLASLLAYLWIILGYFVFLYLLHTHQVKIVEHLQPVEALVETPEEK